MYWTVQVTIWVNFAFYAADTIAVAAQCVPRERIWHPWVQGGCIDVRAVRVSSHAMSNLRF